MNNISKLTRREFIKLGGLSDLDRCRICSSVAPVIVELYIDRENRIGKAIYDSRGLSAGRLPVSIRPTIPPTGLRRHTDACHQVVS